MSSDEEPSFDERMGFYGEDGEWYDRRDMQQTKQEQIYGIFLDQGVRKGRHKHKPTQRAQAESFLSSLNFNFIQGGIQTVNDEESIQEQLQHIQNSQSILKEWESIQQQKRDLHAMRQGPQLGSHGLPQELGRSSKNNNDKKQKTATIGAKKDRGYAKWTKNEKRDKFGGLSFAERYLQKHGFEGRLGVASQGIANPIKQSKARKYNEGLGFNGMDETQHQPKNLDEELQEIKKKTQIEKERMKQKQQVLNIIHHTQPHKKRKISFNTASHYYGNQTQNNTLQIDHDMTNTNHTLDVCPAFRHNVLRMCEMIQERKEILHREGENLKANKHTLQLQLEQLTKDRSIRQARNSTLNDLKRLMNRLHSEHTPSMNEMYQVFTELRNTFYGEYVQYRLWRLFVHVVFPKMQDELDLKDMNRVIEVLVKWRPLLSKDNVYDLLIQDVLMPKIRKELYEWHPLQIDNNERFVDLFARLNDVMSMECYRKMLSELIIPRLNYVLLEMDVDAMTPCIVPWHVLFINPMDDVLTANITKKVKQYWRGYSNDSMQHTLHYIQTLKQWRSVLLHIGMYEDIVQSIVTKRLNEILSECVHLMSRHTVKTAYIEERLSTVDVWFAHAILNADAYIELLQKGFFDAWLRLIYQRLNEMDSDSIQFIWNHLFAVIKNNLFKTEDDTINEWMEHYLNCALDMIHFVVCNTNQSLPSFDVIWKLQIDSKKHRKKRKKKKKKRKTKDRTDTWTNQYKQDMSFHSNQVESVSILEWVQITAENHGIEFCLNPNVQHDGKKVYTFGTSSICLYDKSTIFLKQTNQWKPVDLQDLLRISCSI